jgi:hypothetical protein
MIIFKIKMSKIWAIIHVDKSEIRDSILSLLLDESEDSQMVLSDVKN